MDILDAIHNRRAVRLFTDAPVPDDVIREVVAAGGRAQSSKNTQPWQFIVVQNRDTLKALSQLGDYAGHLAGAAFAVGFVGTQDNQWNNFDLGQAASYVQLAAHELGLGSCIAAIYDQAAGKKLLGIPDDRTFYCAISFGYPALEHQPAKLGGRKPIDDIARWEHW